MTLTLRQPEWLYVLLLVPLLVPGAVRSLSGLSGPRRALALLARSLLVACLALALARPAERETTALTSTVFVADVSDSMPSEDLAHMANYLRAAEAQRAAHHVDFISFARDAGKLTLDPRADSPLARAHEVAGTDIQGALSLALGLLAPERLGQIVLLSDGQETQGQLEQATAQLATLQIPLFVVRTSGNLPAEVAVSALELPEPLKVGEPFMVKVRISSTQPQQARLRLYQNDLLNGLEGVRDVALSAGDTELSFRSVVHVSGPVTYRVELAPQGPDRFPQNNTFARSAAAHGAPRVLYVEGESGESAPFQTLLQAAGFEVDVRGSRGFPTSLRELRPFDFVILSDVPREQLAQASVQALQAYVEDGGGFLMAGGPQSFGLGGYRNSSMEALLPVRLETERRRDQPSLALVLVIDKSGSMSGEKIELAKEAARATSELLGSEDFLGVIGFDAQPDRVVRLSSASNRVGISRGIGKLAAGGGTQIFPALDAAYSDLLSVRAKVKHVILLTDGQTQEKGLPLLVQNMQVDGITVSTIGLGDDVNRSLIEELARLGHGRAYFTTDPSSVPRLFVKETHAVARSSAVEDYVGVRVQAPADFLRGLPMQNAPLLRGYVATRARPYPAQVVLASELGEPVLARMRVGLGWSLAWTPDLKPRWSASWFGWPSHSAFWAQLIREHMRATRDEALRVEARVEGDQLRASLDVLDADERFVNGLVGSLRVSTSDPASTVADQQAPLSQVSPGHYEARVPLLAPGSYVVRAELASPGDQKRLSGETSVAFPFPLEYAMRPPGWERLATLAEVTGGGVLELAEPGAAFRARGRNTVTWRERWSWFVWLGLGLFLADIAARRLPGRRPHRPG
ncbi:MAG: VWA domain-containing protein [Myxococcales bacterium]